MSGCPHWCTRQCWAFVATLLAVIFFIVALALPWYGIAERGTYALPASNTTSEGDLISSFYWTGYVIYINPSTRSLSKIFIFVFHLFFFIIAVHHFF